MLLVHLLKTRKQFKKLRKQEIQIIIMKLVSIKLIFNVIWLMINIKNFTKKAESDKVIRNKAFKIASNPKYDGYERGLASMV